MGSGERMLIGVGFVWGGNKKFLKIDCDEGCTTLSIRLKIFNSLL